MLEGCVEKLAEAMVFLDAEDPSELAGILNYFEKIEELARSASLSRASYACKSCQDILQKLIFNEIDEKQKFLDVLEQTVSGLQDIVCRKRSEESVQFPFQLGISNPQSQVDNEALTDFLCRQSGVLEEIEAMILASSEKNNKEAKENLRRSIHTLKGEVGALGLSSSETLCHRLEESLDGEFTESLVDALLKSKDWLGKTFAALSRGESTHTDADEILAILDGVKSGKSLNNFYDKKKNLICPVVGDIELLSDFVVESREHMAEMDSQLLVIEKRSDDQDAINAVFRAFHTIKGISGYLNLHPITSLAHETENLLSYARKGGLTLSGDVMDYLFSAKDMLSHLVDKVSGALLSGEAEFIVRDTFNDLMESLCRVSEGCLKKETQVKDFMGEQEDSMPRVGEFLIKSGVVTESDITEALRIQSASPERPKLGEVLVRQGKATVEDVSGALKGQTAAAGKIQISEPVKVDAARLDKLLETIGEIVITETMVSQAPEVKAIRSEHVARRLHRLDKITRELQELATSLRMVPLRSTFRRMARLARDVAKKTGKEIDFVIHGEDTEIDRSVVDRLGDPLIHLVRNAIDHGLESTPKARAAAGKPAKGLVELKAVQKGGNVYISICDDGQGLDKEAVLEKAKAQGLINDGQSIKDNDLYRFILLPGFSTAKKVTDVSGRGVGMDVVNKSVEALGGRIDIETELGRGSVFSLCLPLTLSLLEGVVVRVGRERYILPALSVARMLRPELNNTKSVFNKGKMVLVEGGMRPLFRLCELFKINDAETDPSKATVVLIENGREQAALLVDEVLGQQQIVLKHLGGGMQGLPGISGGAIMSDGLVGLVLDAGDLISIAKNETGLN